MPSHSWMPRLDVVGVDTILRTNDGGTSWQAQQDAVPPGTRESPDGVLVHYFAVAFVDALHGIVGGGGPFTVPNLGGPSEILVTGDGGQSWTLAPISGSNAALRNSPASSLSRNGVLPGFSTAHSRRQSLFGEPPPGMSSKRHDRSQPSLPATSPSSQSSPADQFALPRAFVCAPGGAARRSSGQTQPPPSRAAG